MTTSRRSAPRSVPSATRTRLGRTIEAAAHEAAAHLCGEGAAREYTVAVPDIVDVAATRAGLGLSQGAFAARFGLDVTAVQAWEQGRRRPDRTARILLAVIARDPNAVRRALTGE